jgi:hypothetical protein
MTTQASEPSGRQVIATALVRNSRGAGVVPRLTPWFRFRGAVCRTVNAVWPLVISARVPVSKTDTSPWAIWLKRNGPLGEAPVLTT